MANEEAVPLFFRDQCHATTVIEGRRYRCALREGHEHYLDGGVVADPQHVVHIRFDVEESAHGE